MHTIGAQTGACHIEKAVIAIHATLPRTSVGCMSLRTYLGRVPVVNRCVEPVEQRFILAPQYTDDV